MTAQHTSHPLLISHAEAELIKVKDHPAHDWIQSMLATLRHIAVYDDRTIYEMSLARLRTALIEVRDEARAAIAKAEGGQ